jgi:pantetheine-phosphate adenylyltransferase
MSSCVFPGSFDPFTVGHVELVHQARNIFDKVYILVANNPNKKYMLCETSRIELIKQYYRQIPCDIIEIVSTDNLVVDFMKENNIKYIVRGVRDTQDMIEESRLADINHNIGNAYTVFINSNGFYKTISSSLVRELRKHGKNIDQYVPENVSLFLKQSK